MFNTKEGRELLKLARLVIESELEKKSDQTENKPEFRIPEPLKLKFKQTLGVFITIKKAGTDRGTYGYPETMFPLWKSVVQVAKAAAFNDPRFPPINLTEIKDAKIELTILSTLQLLKEPITEFSSQIDIQKHGLILISTQGKSILLPQMLKKYAKTYDEALDMLCEGAGMEKHAWTDPANQIYKFETQIFSE
jgi:AmmeMemoRadiSam system protein A